MNVLYFSFKGIPMYVIILYTNIVVWMAGWLELVWTCAFMCVCVMNSEIGNARLYGGRTGARGGWCEESTTLNTIDTVHLV